jgi:hypothetical protein
MYQEYLPSFKTYPKITPKKKNLLEASKNFMENIKISVDNLLQ